VRNELPPRPFHEGAAPQVNTRTHSQWGACVVPSLKLRRYRLT